METYKNLARAFAGESMARNKYTFFAKQARKEGYESIARIFEETADNERAHAEELFEYIKDAVKPDWEFAVPKWGTTEENLAAAAAGERQEWEEMYPGFEKIARDEGLTEIADMLKEIAEVEEKHEARYKKILERFKEGTTYKREQPIKWKCENCGYVHEGTEPPEKCPVCKKPRNFYEPWCQNY